MYRICIDLLCRMGRGVGTVDIFRGIRIPRARTVVILNSRTISIIIDVVMPHIGIMGLLLLWLLVLLWLWLLVLLVLLVLLLRLLILLLLFLREVVLASVTSSTAAVF